MRTQRRVLPCALLAALIVVTGCTSFGAVRSAEVTPGSSWGFQLSLASPPGDDAAWFWSFDCDVACDHTIPGYDLSYVHGSDGERPFEVGGGLNGTYPYLLGYVQLGGRTEGGAWGAGARLGVPVSSWSEHQLFARYDVRLSDDTRLLLSPALHYFTGNSPNGANPGSFIGFVQGVGLEQRGERVSVIPALSIVAGHTRRRSYGVDVASSWTVFAVLSLSLVVHRRRS